ncbi:MAG: TolC family protein [Bacteroidaceae bacterium]|nr:TolC family protein [Bacteroidaceae bacterium]
MKRNILIIVLATLALSGRAQTLTVESCRTMALQNNRQKQQAALQTKQAEYVKKSTHALFFPDFSLTAAEIYDTGKGTLSFDMNSLAAPLIGTFKPLLESLGLPAAGLRLPDLDIDYKMGWMFTGGIVLKQPIYMGGKIRSAYSMSKTAVDIARQHERLTDAEVIMQTDEAYAQVVKAEEMVEVAKRYRQLLDELDRNVENAVRHGLRHKNERTKVQVKINESDLQLLRAHNAVALSKMNLCRLIGKNMSEDITLSHEYPVVADVNTLRQGDVSLRPEVAMLDGQLEIATQQIKQARSAMLPQVALMAKYGYTNGVKVNGSTFLDGWNFGGGVTLSVPLYHFGEKSNKVKAAQIKQQQMQLERDEKIELMMLELTKASQNVEEAKGEITLAQKSLEQAQTNMTLSKQQYDAGFETLSDYMESQALWQQAYESQVEAHFRLYLASITYLKAAGLLVP